jgi:hypothetical protein
VLSPSWPRWGARDAHTSPPVKAQNLGGRAQLKIAATLFRCLLHRQHREGDHARRTGFGPLLASVTRTGSVLLGVIGELFAACASGGVEVEAGAVEIGGEEVAA